MSKMLAFLGSPFATLGVGIRLFWARRGEVKQPYVAAAVIFTTAVVLYLLGHHALGIEKASFLLAMAVSSLFVAKASVSMQSDAPNVGCLFFFCGLTIFVLALNWTASDHFKDMVVEGLSLQLAGQIGVFLETTIARSNRLRGIRVDD